MGSTGHGRIEDLLEDRRTTNDFRWASRTWTQSPYFIRGQMKDPKELIQLVLASDQVRRAILEVSTKTGKPEKEVAEQAHTIMVELAHDFHMYAIRWFGLTLSKISKKLYNSIQVNVEKIQQVNEAYKSYPVIILPTHRSYVDFLLISFMSFHYELSLPIIAAGMDFLGMAGVGEMLRKSGAFYIRRQFGGDILYWALISEYVKKAVIEGGHPLEMFVEGTRSRSGKSLNPKIGLLSAILELVRTSEVPDILLLPISMSYDRTLEEHLYAHELLGKPKPRESTNGLMKALKWLGSQNYGTVYVNFGNLISARSILRKERIFSPLDDNIFKERVQELAVLAVLDHQRNLVVPIITAVSIMILSKNRRSAEPVPIHFKDLLLNLEFIQRILASRGQRFGFPLRGDSLESNLRFILCVHSLLVKTESNSSSSENLVVMQPGDIVVQSMILQHYSNQCLPLLLPFSIICYLQNSYAKEESMYKEQQSDTSIKSESSVLFKVNDGMENDYVFLRQLFGNDFIYQHGSEHQELLCNVDALNLIGKSYTQTQPQHYSRDIPKKKGTLRDVYRILRHALEPYLIAYYAVSEVLLEVSQLRSQSPCEMKQLGKMCQDFIHQKMRSHLPKQYGALSLDTLANAALSLAARVKLENGSFGIVVQDRSLLESTKARLEKLLGLTGLPLNMERHSIKSNAEVIGTSRISQNKDGGGEQVQLRSKL